MVEIPSRIYLRYYRKTQASPEGTIVHHGDCNIWNISICTCGLIHDLMPIDNKEEFYPDFHKEEGAQGKAIRKLQDH